MMCEYLLTNGSRYPGKALPLSFLCSTICSQVCSCCLMLAPLSLDVVATNLKLTCSRDLVNRHEKSFHPRADILLDPPIEQEVEVTGEDRRLPSPPSLSPPNISS